MTTLECPICGHGTLKKEITTEVFKYKDRSVTIPGYASEKCSVCNESIVDKATLKESGRILRAFKHKVMSDEYG